MAEAAQALADVEALATWFEDGPTVNAALKGISRGNADEGVEAILTEVLEPRRGEWAERFLLMGMWCQAAAEAKYRKTARGLITTAHALVNERPLREIPCMLAMAVKTIQNEMASPW